VWVTKMEGDADDLERLVRKGIRRVRLEDDSNACARAHALHAAQPHPSTVLRTTVSHTVVSQSTSADVHDSAHDRRPTHSHASSPRTSSFAQPQHIPPAHSSLVSLNRAVSKAGAAGRSYLRLLFVLVGSGIVYFSPVAVRILFLEQDTEVGLYQYLLSLLYFVWLLESHYLSPHSPQTPTYHPHVKQCYVITLLKMERESLKRNMAVCADRQYSFYHYPHFHIPLSAILNDIDLINQELLQVELLILKLESGNIEKEYEVILGKVLSKYGVMYVAITSYLLFFLILILIFSS